MGDGLQSPGKGWRYLRFSDGEGAWMNPKLTDQQWAQIKQQGEAQRDQAYMAQEKAEDRPITTQDKVYSATAVRPAGVHGQLMAWLDHHAGGNALNANPTAATISSYVAPVLGSASRIGTSMIERNPYVAATDLGMTGANVTKHLAANLVPSLNRVPDFPTLLSQVQSLTGTPQLSSDAPAVQRVLENAASTAIGNPTTHFLDATGRAATSYLGGEVGEELLGEPGQFVGSFAGSSPGSGRAVLQRVLAPLFRGGRTQEVSGAGYRQGIQPTLGAVSNGMGRLFEKGMAATPWVGAAVRSAQDRFNEAIRQRQQELGEDVFGGPLPGNISDEDIGRELISGARQGSANITQRASNEQEELIHGRPARPATGATPAQPAPPATGTDEHEAFMAQERAAGRGGPPPVTPGQPAQPAQPGIGANTGVGARGVYRGPATSASARVSRWVRARIRATPHGSISFGRRRSKPSIRSSRTSGAR